MQDRAGKLVIRDSQGRRTILLSTPIFTIGRHAEADLVLPPADVSRIHAEIAARAGTFILRDLESRFGTFVNGQRVRERVLVDGDHIRLGESIEAEVVFATSEGSESLEDTANSAATELRHLGALLEGVRALASGRVLDEVLCLVLDLAITVSGAERGFIMLRNDKGELEFNVGRAAGNVTLSGSTFAISRKIPREVFDSGRMTIIENMGLDSGATSHEQTAALGIRYILCGPLRTSGWVTSRDVAAQETTGVLYLDCREPGVKSAAVQFALETLGAEAAIAIQNARLYSEALEKAKLDQELRIAAAMQQSLLPKPQRSGHFYEVAATAIPCRAVGEDFFDFVDFDTGEFGVILGDVAGKGSPAALLAAAVLGMFSAETTYDSHALRLMTRLNRGLLRRAIESKFVTAFYGLLAPDGKLTYTNAGHNPPVLWSRSGIQRLSAGGPLLGMFEAATFEQETVCLSAGDFVVLFSDGVCEALNDADAEFADERLLSCLQENSSVSPQALLAAILEKIRLFCGPTPQNDDITVAVVRYDG